MATHYTLSGHGWDDMRGGEFHLPEGVTIHFYVKSGEKLLVDKAQAMWDALKANPNALSYAEVDHPPVHTLFGGHEHQQRWITRDEWFESGIWKHNPPRTQKFFMDEIEDGEYVSLEDVIKFIMQDRENNEPLEIHWLCCRIHY